MKHNKYDVTIVKVVDGDTVDVDIDLGFGICLKDERVRIMGIDTPESRTSDKVEDLFGEAAKARLKQLMYHKPRLITTEDKHGEDMKGKFGRILGDFEVYDAENDRWALVTEIMIREGHAVEYHGGSKEELRGKHAMNQLRLLREGVVTQADYDKALHMMRNR